MKRLQRLYKARRNDVWPLLAFFGCILALTVASLYGTGHDVLLRVTEWVALSGLMLAALFIKTPLGSDTPLPYPSILLRFTAMLALQLALFGAISFGLVFLGPHPDYLGFPLNEMLQTWRSLYGVEHLYTPLLLALFLATLIALVRTKHGFSSPGDLIYAVPFVTSRQHPWGKRLFEIIFMVATMGLIALFILTAINLLTALMVSHHFHQTPYEYPMLCVVVFGMAFPLLMPQRRAVKRFFRERQRAGFGATRMILLATFVGTLLLWGVVYINHFRPDPALADRFRQVSSILTWLVTAQDIPTRLEGFYWSYSVLIALWMGAYLAGLFRGRTLGEMLATGTLFWLILRELARPSAAFLSDWLPTPQTMDTLLPLLAFVAVVGATVLGARATNLSFVNQLGWPRPHPPQKAHALTRVCPQLIQWVMCLMCAHILTGWVGVSLFLKGSAMTILYFACWGLLAEWRLLKGPPLSSTL